MYNDENYKRILKKEEVLFSGSIFKVVRKCLEYKSGDETGIIPLEIVRRSPGVRAIITDGKRILLTKEFRLEYEDWDYRLPGGKVFDTLDKYREILASSGDACAAGGQGLEDDPILKYAVAAVKRETLEEAGIIARDPRFLCKTRAGATVEWDLYYFVITEFDELETGQNTGKDEMIQPIWKSFENVKEMCCDGRIREDRTVGVLLRFLHHHSPTKHISPGQVLQE